MTSLFRGGVPRGKSMDRSGNCRRLFGGRDARHGSQRRGRGHPSNSDTYRPLIVIDTTGLRLKVEPSVDLSRPASPDVFGTVALNAGVTFYDARFRRVASTDARDPLVQRARGWGRQP